MKTTVAATTSLPLLACFVAWCFVAAASAAPGEIKWRVPLDSAPVDAPVLGTNGFVYVLTASGTLHAFASSDGQPRWATQIERASPIHGPVLGPDGTAYVGLIDGLAALDATTGERKWTSPLPFSYPSIAVGWDGVIFGENYSTFALDPDTGTVRWRFYREDAVGPLALSTSGVLYCGGYSGRLTALDAVDGRLRWEFVDADYPTIQGPSVGADGTVYIISSLGELRAIDEMGLTNWVARQEEGWASYPIVGVDGTVFVGSHFGRIQALDGATGELKWEKDLGTAAIVTPALSADGTLHVSSGNRLHALNSLSGASRWVFEAINATGFRPPNIGPDGNVYVNVLGEDALYILHGTAPLADSPWPRFRQNASGSGQWQSPAPPVITRAPRPRWVAQQAPASFDFYSPAARPLSVQWRFNGLPLAGATNEVLSLANIEFADAGEYSVVISNRHGVATSAAALLSVGYHLAIRVTGPGEVIREPNLDVYPTNNSVHLTATPGTNRQFLRWSGDIASTSPQITVTLDRNLRLTAEFEYLPGDVKWTSPFDDAPALSTNGMLYAFSEGWIVGIDTTIGQRLWRNGYFDSWWAPPALGTDGIVYVGNYGGHSVVKHDGRTGEFLGNFDVGLCAHSCPVIGVDGTLYLTGLKVYAYDPNSDEPRWTFETGDIFETSPALSSDGVLYAPCYDGRMYALDSLRGTKRWEFATEGWPSPPAIGADDTVYFGSTDGRIYAVNGRTGGKRWDYPTGEPVLGSAVIDAAGDIYIGATSNFFALHGDTGELKWSRAANSGGPSFAFETDAAALAEDGTLYIGGAAFDSRTGETLWSSGIGGRAPTIGPDGTVYVGGAAIYGTSPLARSPWPKFHRDAANTGRAFARPLLDSRQSRLTSQGFELVLHSERGEQLTVEWSANLRDWLPLTSITNSPGTVRLVDTDPAGPSATSRFYRTR